MIFQMIKIYNQLNLRMMKKKYLIWMMLLFFSPMLLQGKTMFLQQESFCSGGFTETLDTPIANADVFPHVRMDADSLYPCIIHTLYDEVCQSQTASYDDPYGVVPSLVTAEELDSAIRHAGTYVFTRQFVGSTPQNPDSTVMFTLTVNFPPYRDTIVTISSAAADTFYWHGNHYTNSGCYVHLITRTDSCDSLDDCDCPYL